MEWMGKKRVSIWWWYDTVEHKTTHYKQWINITINKMINNNQMLRLSHFISMVLKRSLASCFRLCMKDLSLFASRKIVQHAPPPAISLSAFHQFDLYTRRFIAFTGLYSYFIVILYFIVTIRSNRINKNKLIFFGYFMLFRGCFCFLSSVRYGICLARFDCMWKLCNSFEMVNCVQYSRKWCASSQSAQMKDEFTLKSILLQWN